MTTRAAERFFCQLLGRFPLTRVETESRFEDDSLFYHSERERQREREGERQTETEREKKREKERERERERDWRL